MTDSIASAFAVTAQSLSTTRKINIIELASNIAIANKSEIVVLRSYNCHVDGLWSEIELHTSVECFAILLDSIVGGRYDYCQVSTINDRYETHYEFLAHDYNYGQSVIVAESFRVFNLSATMIDAFVAANPKIQDYRQLSYPSMDEEITNNEEMK